MVKLSKSRVLPALMLVFALAHAQFFADFNVKSRRHQAAYDDEDDENISAVDKLGASATWWDYLIAQQKDAFNLGGLRQLRDQFEQAYGVLTKDPDALRKHSKAHHERGAMRSGQGTPEDSYRRQKMLEERERLESMYESGEVPTDIPTANKLFELWKEKQADRPGIRQDDKYDLVAHDTVYLHPEDIADADDASITNMGSSRPARILQSVINGDEAVIHRLEEPYPTECYNHGKLAKMSQKYYMCMSLKTSKNDAKKEPFRVSSETYTFLLSNYSDQYSCYTQNIENNVCVCPGGKVDFECATVLKQKCYINITSPTFYKGCEDRPDTFEYLYSVPGFSPCYPQNFSSELEVVFELVCKQIDQNGLVSAKKEDVGYPYRDVIKEPDASPFTYVSSSPETEFSTNALTDVTVAFNFRDMKYLSQYTQFTSTVQIDDASTSDTYVGSINVDFTQLQKKDSSGQSRYIVGGRTYFEAFAFSSEVTSFTFKGFFDEEGYEEPKSRLNNLKSSGWLYVIIIGCIAVVVAAIFLYCYCTRKKDSAKKAKSE